MALPVTISDVSFPSENYYIGPFLSSAGNVYVIPRRASTGRIEAQKATDPTSSFSIVSAGTGPLVQAGTLTSAWCYQVVDVIHLAFLDFGASSSLSYCNFDMSTDTWTAEEVVLLAFDNGPQTAATDSVSIGVRSDGDVIVLYNGDGDAIMGTDYARVDYARKESGSWTTGIPVDGAGEDHWHGASIVMGASDRAHLFYRNDDLDDGYHVTLTSANNLQTPTAFDATGANDHAHMFGKGVAFASGADTKIRVPYTDSTNKVSIAGFVSADNPTVSVVATDVSDTTLGNPTRSYDLAVDVDKQWLLYVEGSTGDLWRVNTGADNDTWDSDVELLDAVNISELSSNIYQRGTDIVFAYIYNDGGTIKYNEYVISSAGGSATVTPTTAALVLATSAPIVKHLITVPVASLTTATFAPSVTQGIRVIPTTAALTLTTFAPTVSTPQTVTPTTAALTLATFAPIIKLVVTPATASLVLSAFAPSIIHGIGVVPSTGSLTTSAFAPTVSTPRLVTPTTAGLTLTTFAPAVTATDPKLVTPTTSALSLSTFAPTVLTPRLVTPTTASLTLTTFTPAIGQGVVPTAKALILTTFAPSIISGFVVTPTTASLSLTTFAPVLKLVVTVTTANLVLTSFAPTVLTPLLATPATTSLVTQTFAPLTLFGFIFTPTTAALVTQTFEPTVLIPVVIAVGAASLSTMTFAPTVSVSDAAAITPATASLVTAAFAPTVSTPVVTTPGTASLALTTFSASVVTPVSVTPATTALLTQTFQAIVSAPAVQTPGPASLTLTTFEPSVSAHALVVPGLAGLILTLFAPTVEVAGGAVLVTPLTASLVLTTFAPSVTASITPVVLIVLAFYNLVIVSSGMYSINVTRVAEVVTTVVQARYNPDLPPASEYDISTPIMARS